MSYDVAKERIYRSDYFPYESEIFYSYTTCNSTADEWIDYAANKELLGGINIRAGENIKTFA